MEQVQESKPVLRDLDKISKAIAPAIFNLGANLQQNLNAEFKDYSLTYEMWSSVLVEILARFSAQSLSGMFRDVANPMDAEEVKSRFSDKFSEVYNLNVIAAKGVTAEMAAEVGAEAVTEPAEVPETMQ